MQYLSIDLEATGLRENDLIIEFAAIPFKVDPTDLANVSIDHSLSFHHFIKCPSFETLRPNLDQWVIEHNEELITKAHTTGLEIPKFKEEFTKYLASSDIKKYFKDEKIVLFGKSLNAIDLPFLNRDLGWNYIRDHFSHQQLDLSSVVYSMIDNGKIPKECSSGSFLMNYLNMGEVAHTALEDAINTAKMYYELLKKN